MLQGGMWEEGVTMRTLMWLDMKELVVHAHTQLAFSGTRTQ